MSTTDTPSIPRLDSAGSDDDIRRALTAAGCCVIENAASDEVMDAVAAEMAPFVEGTAFGDTDFAGAGTRRTGLVVGRSPTFREHLARHRAVLTAGDHVLCHGAVWNLSFAHFFELFPGEPAQVLHRDTWRYGAPPLPFDVDVNAVWAVTDFTESNGATRVVPGSHRWDDQRRPEPGEDVVVIAPKGSVLLYTGNLFHGGGANIGGVVRLAINAQHAVGWLSQTELMLLEYPPAVVADWDDDLIRFIGYQRSGPALGHWRNAEDPFLAVDEYRTMTECRDDTTKR
ncbi:MAG: phytanoyl-CoA dioxygenase family protein [Acidimicrobiales bacterium]